MGTIRIKRGSGTPPLLADGEIAYDKSGKALFVSDGTQNVEFKAEPTTADIPDSTNKRYVSDAKLAILNSTTGVNTGNQTSIVGISGTKSQFNSAVTDGDILYVGDVAQYTDEMVQDAVGAMVTDTSTVRLTYNDGANSMYADLLPSSVNANHLTTTIPLSKFVNDAGFEGVSGLTVRDNANRDRINHTGTQLASTISDFSTASRLATVEDTIVDGVLDKAPSQNAVFDALKIINQNASAVPLYNKYTLAFKGDTNISLNTLQAGDVVERYYDGAINYYNYNGGNVNDDASYTLIGGLSSTQIGKFVDTYVSGTQDFTLPDFAQIISVFVRGHRTENYTVSGNVITINNTIGSGSEVVILYLEDLATGIVPYYTQAQVDSLISSASTGGIKSEYYARISAATGLIDVLYNSIGSIVINRLSGYAFSISSPFILQTTKVLVSVSLDSNTNITDNRSIDYKTNNDSSGTMILLLRENNVLKNYTSPAINISLSIKILN